MNAQRIFTETFVLGALSLFVLALGPPPAGAGQGTFRVSPSQVGPAVPQAPARTPAVPRAVPRMPAGVPKIPSVPKLPMAPKAMPSGKMLPAMKTPGAAKMGIEPSPFMPKGPLAPGLGGSEGPTDRFAVDISGVEPARLGDDVERDRIEEATQKFMPSAPGPEGGSPVALSSEPIPRAPEMMPQGAAAGKGPVSWDPTESPAGIIGPSNMPPDPLGAPKPGEGSLIDVRLPEGVKSGYSFPTDPP